MKKFYQYMMVLLTGVLAACTSMSVSNPYEDSFPADFDVTTYMQLHPELRAMQFRDYADYRNAVTKNSMSVAEYNAAKSADEATFDAASVCLNTLSLIYTSTACAGLPADSVLLKELQAYNIVGETNEVAAFATVEVDAYAISQQYLAFGKSHGWAYRYCDASELGNMTRDQVSVSVINDEGKTVETLIVQLQASKVSDASKFVADPQIYCMDQATGTLHVVNQ